jgi:hypothetical protein
LNIFIKTFFSKRVSAIIILSLFEIFADFSIYPLWWNSQWPYRKKITIDSTNVSGNLTNFPLLIDLPDDNNLAGKAQISGNDITFTDANQNKLSHEIECFNSANGHLVAWVKVNLSSTSDTILYMYYGNPLAANQQNKSDVWDSHYKMIQHLNEKTGTYYDSTVNSNNCYGGVRQGVDGKIDSAVNFDGNNDYINCSMNSSLLFDTNIDFTMEAWVKNIEPTAGSSKYQRIINIGAGSGSDVSFYTNTDGRLRFIFGSGYGSPAGGTNIRDGNWHHVVAVFDRDYGAVQSWVDGVKQNNVSMSLTNNAGTDNFSIGKAPNYPIYPDCWNGVIDEVRISNTIRNASWISTEFKNQNIPGTFYSVDEEEIGILPEDPQIINVTPQNITVNVDLNPVLSIDIIDYQKDSMDIVFYISGNNETGPWNEIQHYNNVTNGTYSVNTATVDTFNKTYFWKVSIDDHHGHSTNIIYNFTTIPYGGVRIENIDYKFEGASLKKLQQAGTNEINFWVDDSQNVEGSSYWFLFKITKGAHDQSVTFNQKNGSLGLDHKCVYSYDGITWEFFNGSQPTWTHTFTQDSVFVAWIIPYQYSFLESYLDNKDASNLPYYNRSIIGHSLEGRNIELITITNDSIPLNEKKSVWIMTGQHPCEKNSQWQTCYMMDFLLNATDKTAQTYRDKYVFKIFPMINPDGIYHGFNRFNAHLIDLNREWDDAPYDYEPEIAIVFDYIKDWIKSGKDIDVLIDQHDLGGYNIFTIPVGMASTRIYNNINNLAYYYKKATLYTNSYENWYSGRSTDVLPLPQFNITALTSENLPQDNEVTNDILRKNGEDVLNAINEYLSNSLSVLQITPVDSAISNQPTVELKYNVSSNLYNVESAKLYINNVLTASTTSVSTTVPNSFTVSLTPGFYKWQVQCTDSNGNIDKSDERALMVTSGNAPYIFNSLPADDTIEVPISLQQLSFTIADPQNDLMSYSVTSSPNIGSDTQINKTNGTYMVNVSGLAYSKVYTWSVNVSDGVNQISRTFSFKTTSEPGVWWNEDWKYRKKITIDHTKVSSNLNNFPVLIDITDSDISSHTQVDGDDIVFTNFSGNKLCHEIESYSIDDDHLVAWVNVPDLSSTEDTILYIYYGNSNVNNQQNKPGVWDSHYKMIQHLSEINGSHYDSTAYNNNGTCYGGVTQNASGLIAGADRFDGTNDYIDCGNDPRLGFKDQITVEAWVNLGTINYDSRIVQKYDAGAGWILWYDGDDKCFEFVARNANVAFAKFSQVQPSINTWYHVVGIYDGSNVRIIVNGVPGNTNASLTNMKLSSVNLSIGKEFLWGYMNGFIDEVRISDTARSTGCIVTEYNNQADPLSFYRVGFEEIL